MTETPRHSTGHDGPAGPSATAVEEQPSLPFDQPLPFDDEADQPIPFSLTARARLAVVPDELPALTVVRGGEDDHEGDLDEPGDTRPARARALRRAGLPVARIATQLETDELAVRAWVEGVHPRRRSRRSHPAVEAERGGEAVPVTGPSGSVTPVAPEPSTTTTEDDHRVAFELARASAREGLGDLDARARFAAGLGLAAARCEIDPHAITAATDDLDLATRLADWLVEHLEVERGRLRVVLRLGHGASGDLARHRWAAALQVPLEQVAYTRWRDAPAPEAVEALVRVADPAAAARLAGWRDAVLDPDDRGPADVAF